MISTRTKQTGLKLIIQPKAKSTHFVGLFDDRIKLAVAAPPVDGKANKEVVSYIASFFGLKKSHVKIVSGERSRKKICVLGDLEERIVIEKLSSILPEQFGDYQDG